MAGRRKTEKQPPERPSTGRTVRRKRKPAVPPGAVQTDFLAQIDQAESTYFRRA
jgi:hypothetical protein